MTEKEITKKLEEINQCMIELQEAKFHDAPKDIIQQLQQKMDILIKKSGRDGSNDKLDKL